MILVFFRCFMPLFHPCYFLLFLFVSLFSVFASSGNWAEG